MNERQKFSSQFITDLVATWEKFGKAAMELSARENPEAFIKTAVALIPKELAMTVSQGPSSIGGFTNSDLAVLNGLIKAISDQVPHAGDLTPVEVFRYVTTALEAYPGPKLLPPADR